MPAKPASILASSATYEALISTSPAWVELSSVIFSTPTTSTNRALPAASVFSPMWMAAEPVAQAFSTRGDGLGGGLHHQRFAGFAVELAELAVGPSDDAGRHCQSP